MKFYPSEPVAASVQESVAGSGQCGLDKATGPVPYGLTNDYMFRAVCQQSEEALRHLLSALLNIPYEEIKSSTITNPIILGNTIDAKTCILDVRLVLNDNRLVNLEMQTGHLADWTDRAVFYLSRLYCSLRRGQDYTDLMPAVHIGILPKSPLEEEDGFYSEYLLKNVQTNRVFTGKFSVRVLNLGQMENVPEEERDSELYYWARLFRAETWEEIRMLSEKKRYLNAAATQMYELSEDEKIQLQCEARERYAIDMSAGMKAGRREGRKEGEENMGALAKALKEDGRLDDIILAANDPVLRQKLYLHYGIITSIAPEDKD